MNLEALLLRICASSRHADHAIMRVSMKRNVGPLDRIIRYLLSAGLIVATILTSMSKGVTITLSVFSGLLFCSATSRVCPLYCPVGVDTGGDK